VVDFCCGVSIIAAMERPSSVHRLVFRATKEPTVSLPFGIRSAGIYLVHRGWHDKRGVKPFVELFWSIAGRGAFRYRDGLLELPANWVTLYLPGENHDITAVSDGWHYCWFTLDGPLATECALAFGLSRHPRKVGACPESVFKQLIESIGDPTPDGQRRAAEIGFRLLMHAAGYREVGLPKEMSASCRLQVKAMLANPELSVNRLARNLEVHRSTLSRSFRKETGMRLVDYIRSIRLAEAQRLLRTTHHSVKEISMLCGFRDANYFSRVFSRAFGLPPRGFRFGSGPAIRPSEE
jgi:AraC-like DNA-binding protein